MNCVSNYIRESKETSCADNHVIHFSNHNWNTVHYKAETYVNNKGNWVDCNLL